ncbi:hypothetical protein DFH11DRAFT_1543410 [Phellopilus nigrolimitatus]|nr:hypothetical protein DFH11DRAFT_1543410 [Phellopilus nigrolimitatus]
MLDGHRRKRTQAVRSTKAVCLYLLFLAIIRNSGQDDQLTKTIRTHHLISLVWISLEAKRVLPTAEQHRRVHTGGCDTAVHSQLRERVLPQSAAPIKNVGVTVDSCDPITENALNLLTTVDKSETAVDCETPKGGNQAIVQINQAPQGRRRSYEQSEESSPGLEHIRTTVVVGGQTVKGAVRRTIIPMVVAQQLSSCSFRIRRRVAISITTSTHTQVLPSLPLIFKKHASIYYGGVELLHMPENTVWIAPYYKLSALIESDKRIKTACTYTSARRLHDPSRRRFHHDHDSSWCYRAWSCFPTGFRFSAGDDSAITGSEGAGGPFPEPGRDQKWFLSRRRLCGPTSAVSQLLKHLIGEGEKEKKPPRFFTSLPSTGELHIGIASRWRLSVFRLSVSENFLTCGRGVATDLRNRAAKPASKEAAACRQKETTGRPLLPVSSAQLYKSHRLHAPDHASCARNARSVQTQKKEDRARRPQLRKKKRAPPPQLAWNAKPLPDPLRDVRPKREFSVPGLAEQLRHFVITSRGLVWLAPEANEMLAAAYERPGLQHARGGWFSLSRRTQSVEEGLQSGNRTRTVKRRLLMARAKEDWEYCDCEAISSFRPHTFFASGIEGQPAQWDRKKKATRKRR